MIFAIIALLFALVNAGNIDVYCYRNESALFEYQDEWGPSDVYYNDDDCHTLTGGLFIRKKIGLVKIYTDSACSVEYTTIDVDECSQYNSFQWKWKMGNSGYFRYVNRDCWDRDLKYFGFSSPKKCTQRTVINYDPSVGAVSQEYGAVVVDFKDKIQEQVEDVLNSVCQTEIGEIQTNIEALQNKLKKLQAESSQTISDFKKELTEEIGNLFDRDLKEIICQEN